MSRYPRQVVRAAVVLAGVALVVQLAGLARVLALSSEYGASAELDAFYLANTCAFALFNIISSGATLVFIPVASNGVSQARVSEFILKLYMLAGLVSLALCAVALGMVASPLLPSQTPGYDFLILFGLLMAGQQVRISTAVWNAVLQSNSRVEMSRILALIPAVAPTLTVVVHPDLTLLCVTILISNVVEMLGNRRVGVPLVRITNQPGSGVPLPWGQLWPVMLSSSMFQAQTIVLTWGAGLLGRGTVTVFNNAVQLALIPQVLILQNLLLVAYPWISRAAEADGLPISGRRLTGIMGVSSVLSHACIIGFVLLGDNAVFFLFARGNFSEQSARSVFVFAAILIASLPFAVIRDYCYRVMYASGEARSASRNSIIVVAITVCLFLGSAPIISELSIPVSIALGTVASALLALRRVRNCALRPSPATVNRRQGAYCLATLTVCTSGQLLPSTSVTGELILTCVAFLMFAVLAALPLRADLVDAGLLQNAR